MQVCHYIYLSEKLNFKPPNPTQIINSKCDGSPVSYSHLESKTRTPKIKPANGTIDIFI